MKEYADGYPALIYLPLRVFSSITMSQITYANTPVVLEVEIRWDAWTYRVRRRREIGAGRSPVVSLRDTSIRALLE